MCARELLLVTLLLLELLWLLLLLLELLELLLLLLEVVCWGVGHHWTGRGGGSSRGYALKVNNNGEGQLTGLKLYHCTAPPTPPISQGLHHQATQHPQHRRL